MKRLLSYGVPVLVTLGLMLTVYVIKDKVENQEECKQYTISFEDRIVVQGNNFTVSEDGLGYTDVNGDCWYASFQDVLDAFTRCDQGKYDPAENFIWSHHNIMYDNTGEGSDDDSTLYETDSLQGMR